MIGGLGVWGIMLWGSYNEAQITLKQKQTLREAKEDQRNHIDELRAKFVELEKEEKYYQPYLTRNKQEQAVLQILTDEVAGVGLTLDSISTQAGGVSRFRDTGNTTSEEFSVVMNIQGTLSQVSTLLKTIEMRYPLIRFMHMQTSIVTAGKSALTAIHTADTASFELTLRSSFKQIP